MREVVLETVLGRIKGTDLEKGTQRFCGVRYATAGRWEYPKETFGWEGIYDATVFGAASYQKRAFYPERPDAFYYKEFRENEEFTYSEDCFFLNIWKPEHCEKAPVIFYIHGGAFLGGCGNEKQFDGSYYAQKGVIFITCNYRLGALGYCALPELAERDGHTGNYGLYDQLTALKWVYHNINQFGGDATDITVMGQSAGAMSAQQLCMSPLAREYISKAIMTSGGGVSDIFGNMAYVEDTYSFWKDVMAGLGRNLEEWKRCSAKELFEVLFTVMKKYPNAIQNCSPVIDGTMVLYNTEEMKRSKLQARIPYIMGCTKDDLFPEEIFRMAKEWTVLQTQQGLVPSYCFYFSRNLPGDHEGAWHSSELWYTIGALKNCWRPWEAWDYKISDTVMKFFVNFVKSGNPNDQSLPEWKTTCSLQDDILIITDSDIKMGNP